MTYFNESLSGNSYNFVSGSAVRVNDDTLPIVDLSKLEFVRQIASGGDYDVWLVTLDDNLYAYKTPDILDTDTQSQLIESAYANYYANLVCPENTPAIRYLVSDDSSSFRHAGFIVDYVNLDDYYPLYPSIYSSKPKDVYSNLIERNVLKSLRDNMIRLHNAGICVDFGPDNVFFDDKPLFVDFIYGTRKESFVTDWFAYNQWVDFGKHKDLIIDKAVIAELSDSQLLRDAAEEYEF